MKLEGSQKSKERRRVTKGFVCPAPPTVPLIEAKTLGRGQAPGLLFSGARGRLRTVLETVALLHCSRVPRWGSRCVASIFP